MNKIHLYKRTVQASTPIGTMFSKAKMYCGFQVCDWDAEQYEVLDYKGVTCEHCKDSDKYKELKQLGEQMDQIKSKAVEEFNEVKVKHPAFDKPKMYKQLVEIEVPVGMEVDGSDVIGHHANSSGVDIEISFKPKVKTGAELVGCLCGVSDMDINTARIRTTTGDGLSVITGFSNDKYESDLTNWLYAYPVPLEELNELKARLISS